MLLDDEQKNSTFSHLSPVFVLAIYRYHQLSRNTYFVTGVGNKKRVIPLGPVVNALGAAKIEALPGFHAFSGANVTGRFAGKGKLMCWQALSICSVEVISAFAALETSEELRGDIETFVCQLYVPNITVVMLVISSGSFSRRNNWKLKSYHRHEEPYTKPFHEHITKPWCGIKMTFHTQSYHQQQTMGGRKTAMD